MRLKFILKMMCFLSVFSLASFTPGDSLPDKSSTENCEMSVQSNVRYGFQRKMIDGVAFSKKTSTNNAFSLHRLSKGTMEICVGTQGVCKWSFSADGKESGNDVSVEVTGLEEIVKAINLSSDLLPASTASFVKIAKDKGAKITDLGNGTISIRQTKTKENMTTVTIVDTKKQVILGSSVYDENNTLKAKVICKYKGVFTQLQLHTVSLLVFEHAMGDTSGWVTEVIASY